MNCVPDNNVYTPVMDFNFHLPCVHTQQEYSAGVFQAFCRVTPLGIGSMD